MKTLSLFALFISCFILVKAADKCDLENFKKCITTVLEDTSKTAQAICSTADCGNVTLNWPSCIAKVYGDEKNAEIVNQTLVSETPGLLSIENTFICDKKNGIFCYDLLRNVLSGKTNKNEFYCNNCGQLLKEKYAIVQNTIADKESDLYKKVQEKIDEVENVCNPKATTAKGEDDNGAFAMTSLKVATFLIIGLVSFLLL